MPPIRKHLKRRENPLDVRFLTFSCHRRLPLFEHPSSRDAFAAALAGEKFQRACALFAWVVMPEHVHLMLRRACHQTLQRKRRRLRHLAPHHRNPARRRLGLHPHQRHLHHRRPDHKDVREFETGLLNYMKGTAKPVWDEIAAKKALDADLEKKLETAIKTYKSTFKPK